MKYYLIRRLILTYFQVGVVGLSREFTQIVRRVLNMGFTYLRRNLQLLVSPLRKLLNELLVKYAPDDLSLLIG